MSKKNRRRGHPTGRGKRRRRSGLSAGHQDSSPPPPPVTPTVEPPEVENVEDNADPIPVVQPEDPALTPITIDGVGGRHSTDDSDNREEKDSTSPQDRMSLGELARYTSVSVIAVAVVTAAIYFSQSEWWEEKTEVELTETSQQEPVPQELRYEIRWSKPPGVDGGLKRVRERCLPATVVARTDALVRIEAAYLEHGQRQIVSLVWDRTINPEHGQWHQARPHRSGKWYLNSEGLGAWTLDGEEEWIPFRLITTSRQCPVT